MTRGCFSIGLALVVACGSSTDESPGGGAAAPASSDAPSPEQKQQPAERPPFVVGEQAPDGDPDADADPNAPSPPDDPVTPPSTQDQLIAKFAPHVHLHPDDDARPANVDWYLARVSMRFNHDDCPDHEILALGKVTQAALVAQTHEDNKSLCRHDSSKPLASTGSDLFFLEVADHASYKGSPRAEWKTYVVWRPQTSGLVNIEYWFFYPFNDGFTIFNHESDWEHVRVTIDPKTEKFVETRFSQHNGGQLMKAGDPKLTFDGTHLIAYSAKGTHANYPGVGTFTIPGVPLGVAEDATKAAPLADVWKTENALVQVGTRAAPKNGQVFVKFWGRWGEIGDLPETSGITRHFP